MVRTDGMRDKPKKYLVDIAVDDFLDICLFFDRHALYCITLPSKRFVTIKNMQEPSIFTRIINGEIPAHKIYEDDRVIAILDLHPMTEGHTLVVPKIQVNHIWDLEEDDYTYLWISVKKIGTHIQRIIGSPRVGISVEGFGVPHVHVHLIPIYHGEDMKKPQDLYADPDNELLAAVAAKLKM